VITDPGSVASTDSVPIVCEAPDDELLLVVWLNALVYEMASHVLHADRKKGEP
jgi:SHS2 domain-containing protein